MPKSREIYLYPCAILKEGSLHINITEGPFPDREYKICNQTGNIIRRGMVGNNTTSFSLRVTGLEKGDYEFIMCNQHLKFTVN